MCRSSSRIGVSTAGGCWPGSRLIGYWPQPAASAKMKSSSRAGNAQQTRCIVERIAPRSAPRRYWSVSDWGPSSTKDEQRWASVRESIIWTNPLVLPARLRLQPERLSSVELCPSLGLMFIACKGWGLILGSSLWRCPEGNWEFLKLFKFSGMLCSEQQGLIAAIGTGRASECW